MSLVEQIDQDLTAAMREQMTDKLSTLRLIKSSFKNEQIKLGHELSDEEAMAVLKREAKQRRDSIDQYQSAGRDDLVATEQQELEIVQAYLPKQMSDDDLKALVDKVVAETGASSPAEMGVVIGSVLKQSAGRADGGAVARLVKERLSK